MPTDNVTCAKSSNSVKSACHRKHHLLTPVLTSRDKTWGNVTVERNVTTLFPSSCPARKASVPHMTSVGRRTSAVSRCLLGVLLLLGKLTWKSAGISHLTALCWGWNAWIHAGKQANADSRSRPIFKPGKLVYFACSPIKIFSFDKWETIINM